MKKSVCVVGLTLMMAIGTVASSEAEMLYEDPPIENVLALRISPEQVETDAKSWLDKQAELKKNDEYGAFFVGFRDTSTELIDQSYNSFFWSLYEEIID